MSRLTADGWMLIAAQLTIALVVVLVLMSGPDDDRDNEPPRSVPPNDGDVLPIERPTLEPEIIAALDRSNVSGH